MIDAITALLRAGLIALGFVATADPAGAGSALAIAAVILAVATLVATAIAATAGARASGASVHPTRHAERRAPLAQSDPDAAGHIRRRGPGHRLSAA